MQFAPPPWRSNGEVWASHAAALARRPRHAAASRTGTDRASTTARMRQKFPRPQCQVRGSTGPSSLTATAGSRNTKRRPKKEPDPAVPQHFHPIPASRLAWTAARHRNAADAVEQQGGDHGEKRRPTSPTTARNSRHSAGPKAKCARRLPCVATQRQLHHRHRHHRIKQKRRQTKREQAHMGGPQAGQNCSEASASAAAA